jgi:SNF2 family DNA or RNA helicase
LRARQGTKRARALAKIAHTKINRFIGLTGTPAPNGLQDLFAQGWFIDGGERLGKTFTAFSNRWFRTDWSGYGIVPLPHARREIEAKLSDVCLSLKAEDWFDLQKPIVNKIYVDLPPHARKLYKAMEKDLFVKLERHEVEAFNAASMTIKCLQLAQGALYVEESNEKWEEIHNEKIQALESIVEEANGAPVLVAYNFRSDLERLRRHFRQSRQLDANPKTLKDWNLGKIPILLAHPASAGHGLSLQDGGNIIAFFGCDWNLENHMQILERIGPVRQMQSGHNRPVFVHYILARNTIDEQVLERLESKRSVQDILLEAMRLKG